MESVSIAKVLRLDASRLPPPSLDEAVEIVREAWARFAVHWEGEPTESDLLTNARVALYLYDRYRNASLAWDDIPGDVSQFGLMAFGAIIESIARRQAANSLKKATKVVAAWTATERAYQRHENDPKQQAKREVYGCWEDWKRRRSGGSDPYKSKAAFARDMLGKFPALASQKVIEDWCREWERGEIPASDVAHQLLIHIGK
ncbi:hypothetical protein BURKHO8Y_240218 [Burkholderia sp. 8Y]|uniref:hypothetical protein n=1 Tax=Burkholderia sp. 8Y TaxID=2653133 RepID=UPI0012F19B4B|nr:hypothetical protein [Burkholderia sp. 8Y]VXC59829.1 hypothetical protein BURKHO8Y_240218 [Burkholderia sp. 8Y]